MSKVGSGRVFSQCLVVSKPHTPSKLTVCPQNEQLIRGQLPPPMSEKRSQDRSERAERFDPANYVLDSEFKRQVKQKRSIACTGKKRRQRMAEIKNLQMKVQQ